MESQLWVTEMGFHRIIRGEFAVEYGYLLVRSLCHGADHAKSSKAARRTSQDGNRLGKAGDKLLEFTVLYLSNFSTNWIPKFPNSSYQHALSR